MIRRAATLAAFSILGFLRSGEAQAPDTRPLAEFVAATALESAGRSTEGTVVARFENLEEREPIQVWVREKGALRDGTKKDLDRAFGNIRRKWPPYTLLYSATPGDAGRYVVEVSIYYDMGLFPESRGGYSERWNVAHQDGRWLLLDKETTLHWD